MKKYIVLIILATVIILGVFKCPIYTIAGIPCPTCGITRAYRMLLCGNVLGAFKMHPLFWLPPLFIFRKMRKTSFVISASVLFFAVYIWRFYTLFPNEAPFIYNSECYLGTLFAGL